MIDWYKFAFSMQQNLGLVSCVVLFLLSAYLYSNKKFRRHEFKLIAAACTIESLVSGSNGSLDD